MVMRAVSAAMLMCALLPAAAWAQQPPPPTGGGQATPRADTEKAPPTTSTARVFTTPAGIILNAVRPERVADFEKVVGYLQAALASSTDSTVRAQAQGWRVFKASETGPNGSVLYVFLLDPTMPGTDYGLGRILAEAYPEQAKLQEIWKLYTDSLASGGSLLSLTPVMPTPPAAAPQP
jgi:hypothetical protein